MEGQENKGNTILMDHQEITIPKDLVLEILKKKVTSKKEEEDSTQMTRVQEIETPEDLPKCTMIVPLENQDRKEDLPVKASEEEALHQEVTTDLPEAISILKGEEENLDPLEAEVIITVVNSEEDEEMNSLKALIELKWAALLEVIVASSEALVEAEEVAVIEEDIMNIAKVLIEVAAELENLGFLPTKGMELSVERAKRQLLLECTKDQEEVELKVPSKTEPDFPKFM
jgi:hypothetical protein